MQYLVKSLTVLVLCLSSLLVQAAEPRQLDDILKSGELRIGLSLFTPWTMRAKDGSPIGSEVDIARRLAADMGVTAKLAVFEWDQLIDALNKGDIDVVVAGMSVTPQRALKVSFSQPYGRSGIGLAANIEMTGNFKSIEDLRKPSVSVGAVKGTVAETMAKRLFAKADLKTFATEQEAVDALLGGQLHAYVESNPMPKFLALKHPEKVDVPLNKPLYGTRQAFAVRQGDQAFLNFLNAWVVSRTADAWLETTHSYWFESLDWREQTQ